MVRQVRPGQQEATASENSIQPRPDVVPMAFGIAASPAVEKAFPFLRLPAEIRNMVYEARYRSSHARDPDGIGVAPDLNQPAITMVNRQIRCESLPIFYNNHHFYFDLTFLWDRPNDADDGQSLLSPFSEMIHAFAPTPGKALESNNLRFLSRLTVTIDIEEWQEDGIVRMGFTMSNKDKGDEVDMVLDTAGLDSSHENRVAAAYVNAVKYGFVIGYVTVLEMDEPTVEACHELIDLMCLLASHCPQLTRRVCALVIYNDGWLPITQYVLEDCHDGGSDMEDDGSPV